MKTYVLRIRFELFGSVLFAVIAYAVSVNMEIGFFTPNWWWMSNNFALTVSGGIFTGFLVALLSEVREYGEKKLEVEDEILYNSKEVYALMGKVYGKIINCLKNPDTIVSDEIFGSEERELKRLTEQIENIKKCARWFTNTENNKKLEYISKLWFTCFCLDLNFSVGLLLAKMKNFESNKNAEDVTFGEIAEDLRKTEKDAIQIIEIIEDYLQSLPDDNFSKDELEVINKMRSKSKGE